MERRSVVIGGGGLTATTAVGTLRERGFDGRIALVAVERHEPYIRPPLSKGYLAGCDGLDEVFVHPSSWYTDNAVELLLGTRVDEVDPGARSVRLGGGTLRYDGLLLATGATSRRLRVPGAEREDVDVLRTIDDSDHLGAVPADLVVVGVGAVPAVALAAGIGLPTANGIEVGGSMATSAPGVCAADDVADAYLPAIERRLRSEHWANAITGGRIAARGMLGERISYNEISYFYNDQYDRGMEYSGYAPLTQGAEVVYRGDPDAQEFLAFWTRGGWVVAGISLNVWDVNDQVQRIIRTGKRVDSASLADVDIPLSTL